MEEILHHRCIKPCKSWDIYHINWCKISSINSSIAVNVFKSPVRFDWMSGLGGFRDQLINFVVFQSLVMLHHVGGCDSWNFLSNHETRVTSMPHSIWNHLNDAKIPPFSRKCSILLPIQTWKQKPQKPPCRRLVPPFLEATPDGFRWNHGR